jgi:uncharacterized OB-fold protein
MTAKAVDGAGTLYSFSIVHAAPKHWNAPYALGYVDLPSGLRVLGQVQPMQKARIGAACRLELGMVGTRPDGKPAVSYVFVPEE